MRAGLEHLYDVVVGLYGVPDDLYVGHRRSGAGNRMGWVHAVFARGR